MHIAQVAPLFESVPPKLYGGTERVVHQLTEELVRAGHDVTLFASGDSETSARLVAGSPRALRLAGEHRDAAPRQLVMLEKLFRMADDFDVIHFHTDILQYPLLRRQPATSLTTLHGRLDLPELVPFYREYIEAPVSSISDAQREPLPWLNWQGTVQHGYERSTYSFHDAPGDYLAFLGRISPEKGAERAIMIARAAGLPLRIAAKVDRGDREFFDVTVRPHLGHDGVEFVGEIGDDEKSDFLGEAKALLFPVEWPEPFGLVMIEAMACGTPCIAFRRGSVPEIVTDGVTGFIVDDVPAAVRAIDRIGSIDRRRCRREFEARFTAERMARDYVDIYERLRTRTVSRLSMLG